MELHIKKISDNAKIPQYAHKEDAGMDLFASEEVVIASGERALVKTGIAMAIPEGFVGLIWDKSGVSNKLGLKVLGGVVDAGYRGEVLVGLINLSNESVTFNSGDKVAQMLIQKVESPTLIEVEELSDTERGDGGFGSTGK